MKSLDFDLSIAESNNVIDQIQSVFVDNSLNSQPLTLIVRVTGQCIVVAAGQQGVYPVICQNPLQMTAKSTGNVIVPLLFLNVPMATAVWGGVAPAVSIAPITGAFVDRSGVTPGVITANAARKRVIIQNPVNSTDILRINFGGAAASAGVSLELVPGGSFDTSGQAVDVSEIDIGSTTVGLAFIAKEM